MSGAAEAGGGSVAALVEAAEREAMRVAAFVRIAVVGSLLVLFVLSRPAELPPAFAEVVQAGIVAYIVLALVGLAASRARRIPGATAAVLAVLDVAVYAGLIVTAGLRLGISPVTVVALPPFLFVLLLFALAALHSTVTPIVATVASILLFGTAMIVAQVVGLLPDAGPADLPEGIPVFGARVNLLRFFLIGASGIVMVMVVVRARRRLTQAIAITERSANLSRYLPGAIARTVADRGIDALGSGRIQDAAVLFADIEGFTRFSAGTDPAAVGRLLTEVRVIQRRIVEEHGGIVDKFIGDAVMAVFGVPAPAPDDARRALAAAQALDAAQQDWRDARLAAGHDAVRIGIGLHYGPVFAGAIGDAERLEFATLGDTVNVAARVEGLTRSAGASLLVTRAALEAAGADPAGWEPLPPQPVRGRDAPVEVLRARARRAA
ncbi:MAG: adenylate/guanylate cyclase domain-containing protein [Rhodospirillaceae bacterium]